MFFIYKDSKRVVSITTKTPFSSIHLRFSGLFVIVNKNATISICYNQVFRVIRKSKVVRKIYEGIIESVISSGRSKIHAEIRSTITNIFTKL